MIDVTLWTGPVGNAQVPACFVPGSVVAQSFGCQNPEPPPERQPPVGHIYSCQKAADRVRSGYRYLPGMLRAAGINPADVSKVYLASFSAGHNVVKDRVFMSAEDRALVKTFYSCDSTYTGWKSDNPKLGPEPNKGYLNFMLDCLKQPKLFLASAGKSTPFGSDGKPLPSSAEAMWSLAAAIENLTGLTFKPIDLELSVKPAKAMRLDSEAGGSIILTDFPQVQHQDQPKVCAPALWKGVLLPWLGIDPCKPVASLAGPSDAASCPVYFPEPSEPWMQTDVQNADFMAPAPKPSAPASSVNYPLLGVLAATAAVAYFAFSKPKSGV